MLAGNQFPNPNQIPQPGQPQQVGASAINPMTGQPVQQAQPTVASARPQPLDDAHIDDLLRAMHEKGSSDLHLAVGIPPIIRVDGALIPLPYEKVTPSDSQRLIYDILTDEQIQRFETDLELDFSYPLARIARFRVNVFRDKGNVATAFRQIPQRIPTIKELGLPGVLEELTRLPRGLVLVTGPTGSGKTTTLYAAINETKNDEDKIITIEDPVEYQVRGITQIPVNEKKGLTFARGLRSILRHDPDKIMVGEIRDQETAQIAINSALTGHLVFTTVHANNVTDVIGRFINMGVEPYNFVSALNCILAQRLVRVICENCKRRVTYPAATLSESGLDPKQWGSFQFCEGTGCLECSGTGYHGRTAITELLDLSDSIREMIIDRRPTSEIKRVARESGMTFLRESGLRKVRAGITTLREINKVTFIE